MYLYDMTDNYIESKMLRTKEVFLMAVSGKTL